MFKNDIPMTYEEFRVDYLKRYPSKVPRKRKIHHVYPRGFGIFIGFMFVCAAILSGVHTIPTTYYGIESTIPESVRVIASIGSFVAVELAIFSSAYMMATDGDRRLGWTVLILSSLVALTANLWSVSKAINQTEEAAQIGSVIVVLIMGICMPAIALASGKLFVNVHRSNRKLNIEFEDKLDDILLKLDEEIVSEYEKYLSKMDRRTRRTGLSERTVADGQRTDSGQVSGFGYNRTADGKDKVINYLRENPDDVHLSVRDLGQRVGVGKSTAAEGKAAFMSNGHSNGNGHYGES